MTPLPDKLECIKLLYAAREDTIQSRIDRIFLNNKLHQRHMIDYVSNDIINEMIESQRVEDVKYAIDIFSVGCMLSNLLFDIGKGELTYINALNIYIDLLCFVILI